VTLLNNLIDCGSKSFVKKRTAAFVVDNATFIDDGGDFFTLVI
jgi:hypothetical protein